MKLLRSFVFPSPPVPFGGNLSLLLSASQLLVDSMLSGLLWAGVAWWSVPEVVGVILFLGPIFFPGYS